jgi:NADPH:quinone reductase-like Zn-dependent oxidoreductase
MTKPGFLPGFFLFRNGQSAAGNQDNAPKAGLRKGERTMLTMKAIRFHTYGGPEVLVHEDAPRPEAATGEVLIRVTAAGVNPVDWKVRAGHTREWLQHRLPLIPGWDVSGVVEAVGPDVSGLKAGDEVFGMLDLTRDGAYAEYAVARASDMARKPASVSHIHAASLPIAALTAWQALFDVARLAPGQTVLIHGAAGGVGHFAVQFAKWKGAQVIVTASARNTGFVRELGADRVIDYQTTRFEEAVNGVDVVLDTIGGDTQQRSWQVLKKGGVLVSTLGIATPQAARDFGVRGEEMFVRADAGQLGQIAALVEAKQVRPYIASTPALADAAKAHEQSETGHVRGKIVLRVSE